jgi:tRNA(Ile)-lysidine synthase
MPAVSFLFSKGGPRVPSKPQRTVPLHRRAAYRSVVAGWSGQLAVACSGGVDSTALLLIAAEARDRGRIAPFVCLHVDHLARSGSSEEAHVVAATCRSYDVPFVRLVVDQKCEQAGSVSEDMLRRARYRALSRASEVLGLDGIVTAHTFDDQIETILMRLFTGAGPLSAAGMLDVQHLSFDDDDIRVVRPLLAARRTELQAIVTLATVDTVEDPTNADTSYRRNRLRNCVVPLISDTFPGFQHALARSATLARQDAELLDTLAQQSVRDVVRVTENGISVDRDWIRCTHPALSSRVIRLVLTRLMAGEIRELTRERIDSVRNAALGRTGARIELSGCVVAEIRRSSVDFTTIRANGEPKR